MVAFFAPLLFIFISMRIAAKLLNEFASIFFCTHLSQCCRVVFLATKKWENETMAKKKERKWFVEMENRTERYIQYEAPTGPSILLAQFTPQCERVWADTDRDLRQTYSCECVCVIERCLRRRWYTSNQIFCVAIRFIAHFTFVSSLSVRFYRFCWICVLLCVNPHIVCVVQCVYNCTHIFAVRFFVFFCCLGMECRVKEELYLQTWHTVRSCVYCMCVHEFSTRSIWTCSAHPFVRERVKHMRYTTDNGSGCGGGGDNAINSRT